MLKYPYTTGESINNLKYKNEKLHHYFFSKGAIKFFNSRILPTVYKYNYFITSEQFDYKSKRFYKIRQSLQNGEIKTIEGDFSNKYQAEKRIKELIDSKTCKHCGLLKSDINEIYCTACKPYIVK